MTHTELTRHTRNGATSDRAVARLRARLTGRRPAASAVIAACATLAFFLRAYQLTRPGYLFGVTEYDDGVLFGNALRLVAGVIPYRDFFMVQPPGGMLLMAPAALLAKLAGTARGLAAARALTVGADTANVVLLGLLVRHRGPVAAAIACGLYAVYPDAIVAAHTFLLEPWLNLFCLAGAVAIFDRDRLAGSAPRPRPAVPGQRPTATRRAPRWPDRIRLLGGGLLFGFAVAIKIWALLPLAIAALLVVVAARRIRPPATLAAGAAIGLGVPLLQFALLAPAALARGVLIGQLVRNASGSRHLPQRLADLAGLGLHPFWPHERLLLAAVVAALIGCCAAAYLPRGRPRGGRRMQGPTHPARPTMLQATAAAAAVLLIVGLGYRQFRAEAPLRGVQVPAAADRLIPAGACVVSNGAAFTVGADRFYSDVPGCPAAAGPPRTRFMWLSSPSTNLSGMQHDRRTTRTVQRSAPPPRPGVVDGCAALAGLGFGAVLAAVVTGESAGTLRAPGGLLTAAGRLAGFSGTYLMLIMVVLVARLPWLERAAGQDQLVRWHRQVSPWALGLIAAHVLLITLGYAQAAQSGTLREVWVLATSYPDMLAAFVGFGLLVLAGVTSVRLVKRRIRYETWWVVHLYLYLGLALAFAHQIATGVSFIGHPLVRDLWIMLWAATAGMVLAFRVLLPIGRSLRHQLRVVAVRPEAPGVVSVICRGRRLDRLPVSGGQFLLWRFLTRDLWWQAHPYSLSALPSENYLRITIKGLGDQSHAAGWLRPGTRVAIEGPYGAFTSHAARSEAVLLVGAGVGITPLRAMLEDLPSRTDVVVLLRASTVNDLIHRREVAELVAKRRGRLYEVVGPRHQVRFDARTLSRIVPDISDRDVYVCGPDGFSSEVARSARRLRVSSEQIHIEAFGF